MPKSCILALFSMDWFVSEHDGESASLWLGRCVLPPQCVIFPSQRPTPQAQQWDQHLLAERSSSPSLNAASADIVVEVRGEECSSTLQVYRRTLLRIGLFSYNSLGTVCFAFFHSQSVGRSGRRLVDYPAQFVPLFPPF